MSYSEINTRLVEEFGNLEHICSQIYHERHGVTCYIEDMEHTGGGSIRIANWERDLRKLKAVRHKRNQLSHGEVSFSAPWAEQEDINFIVDFRRRILNGTDPLTQYRRPKSPAKPQYTPSSRTTVYHRPQPSGQSIGYGICIAVFGGVVAVAAWLLMRI